MDHDITPRGQPSSSIPLPLSRNNERDLFPNLSVFGRGVEFDHLPRLRPHLHAICERIHRHHRGKHRPRHLFCTR